MLLLLAMPEALSGAACVDVPLATTFLSLPFYLLVLLGSSVHVLVCTSSEASCYFCSLPWLLAFIAIVFSSALFCSLVSMAARRALKVDNKQPKVSETEKKRERQCGIAVVSYNLLRFGFVLPKIPKPGANVCQITQKR